MRALSIRQPYAELILRGIKTVEFRSRRTTRIGERFYIYASRQWAVGKLYLEGCGRPEVGTQNGSALLAAGAEGRTRTIWSGDLAMPGEGPEPWMMELANMLILKDLPTGVIVGSAVITECKMMNREEHATLNAQHSTLNIEPDTELLTGNDQPSALFGWRLGGVERAKRLRKPKGQPQPVWFTPF